MVQSQRYNKISPWNFNRNSYIFIQENTFENVVRKMAAILSQPQCVSPASVIVRKQQFHLELKRRLRITISNLMSPDGDLNKMQVPDTKVSSRPHCLYTPLAGTCFTPVIEQQQIPVSMYSGGSRFKSRQGLNRLWASTDVWLQP